MKWAKVVQCARLVAYVAISQILLAAILVDAQAIPSTHQVQEIRPGAVCLVPIPAAVVEAIFVYNSAMRDLMLPRKPLPHPELEDKRKAPLKVMPRAEVQEGKTRIVGNCMQSECAPFGSFTLLFWGFEDWDHDVGWVGCQR